MKLSLVITTFNEAKTIREWCKSLKSQTLQPDEVVVVDSDSSDSTVNIIKEELSNFLDLKVIVEKCNISRGRNLAISNASHENILITDAGVKLSCNWVELMSSALSNHDAVAGYYMYSGDNSLQKAYKELFYKSVKEVEPSEFLPSSRSLALKKHVWSDVGGYNEDFDIGEDTEFDLKIKSAGYTFHFCPEAMVSWDVRESLFKTYKQHYNYSLWDGVIGQNQFGHLRLGLIFLSQIIFAALFFIYLGVFSFSVFFLHYFVKFFKDENRFRHIRYKVALSVGIPIVKAVAFCFGKARGS
ncbi:glycosyltransferase [Pseudoalteromonas luteoviolacea]|uniref:Glycosyltransferase 2-like domain-containing protein n=1 Tax=Pseudoalteromonas luteoviolacea H33 TaxID=1365251 RepID=A0A162AKE5_9GAMM|nr:glycosyltransferase [Pseudoalteromonas luteoviolacea]KZN51388.1 hypothetical protein N476_13450 [Pseudoalteromonas luteoviolacea H33]KZN71441.1 hypothetical protein N477_03970 [Pseudoalteromonas luteoviolacea H33-S]MBQ4876797.1 glycosyltransferase [Pseudoalteromonas luteoviolacea]MBQ4905414.1 glycosyltransferase [Pseudoalteromonas luteoviolacea]